MKFIKLILPLLLVSTVLSDDRVYEMRIYTAGPGKIEALHARFRNHTCKLFEKHGITNIGYWVPVDEKDSRLIFVLGYPSRDDREKAWKAFLADPDWKRAFAESEKDGPLVTKVENTFMQAVDYSPAIKPAKTGERLFELRTYRTEPGRLAALNARFRNHTCKLFEKHGIANVAYWTRMADQPDAATLLVYIVAHKSSEKAAANWKAFSSDPVWQKARAASEKDGKILAQRPESVYLKPTVYSPIY